MDRPTEALHFAHLMLGDLALQRRQVKYLAALDHDRRTQGAMTNSAFTRWVMGFNPIRLGHALEGMTGVAPLAAHRLLAAGAQ